MSAGGNTTTSMYALDARRRITLSRGSASTISGERHEILEERMRTQLKTLHILGVIEIILGAISFTTGIIAIIYTSTKVSKPNSHGLHINQGVWFPVISVVAGAMGLRCTNKLPKRCQVAFNLGFSLVAALFSASGILLVMEVMFIWLNAEINEEFFGLLIAFEVTVFVCMTMHIISAGICCCNMQDMKEPFKPFSLHKKTAPELSLQRSANHFPSATPQQMFVSDVAGGSEARDSSVNIKHANLPRLQIMPNKDAAGGSLGNHGHRSSSNLP